MISKDQKKYLRSLLHTRGIIIWIGQNGLTENVMNEIEAALDHHELLKIRIRTGDSSQRDNLLEQICAKTGAEAVQKIGTTVSVYRPNRDKPVIRFPN
jgi:RNA-binding protein